MFLQRALITLTLGPLALYLIFLGGLFYFIPVTIVLALAIIEYSKLTKNIGWHVPVWLLLITGSLQWILGQWPQPALDAPVLALSLLAIMSLALWHYEKQSMPGVSVNNWMATLGGFLILGWIGGHFFRLRGIEELAWQWTMLAMLRFADSGAYLVGKFLAGRVLLGRHRLSPRLSPNKTVEGYIGGIILSTLLILLIAALLTVPITAALILVLTISVLTPLGDLGISLIKREAGVKDSGVLFPGHGGALDRIDSLLWAVTLAYYLALFIL